MDRSLTDLTSAKRQWRSRLFAARRTVSADTRRHEAEALTARLTAAVTEVLTGSADGPGHTGPTVCAYVPIGTEPGSPAMLDALVDLGVRVLLPVVAGPRALNWAVYLGPGSLDDGSFGLAEPTGPRLGADAVAEADLVFVPALAVDRAGVRLGRGAGHYDRSLPLVRAGVPLVAVVRDDELVDQLPAAPHDVLMTAALTPGLGLVPLP